MSNGPHQPPRPRSVGPADRPVGLLQESERMPEGERNQPRGPAAYRRHPYGLATRLGDLVRSSVVVLFRSTLGILAVAAACVAVGSVVWAILLVLRALGV